MAAARNTTGPHENKIKSSVSLSQYLIEWMDEEIQKKKFSSKSGMIEIALSEMKGRQEAQAESQKEENYDEDDDVSKLMLRLLTRHQELVEEVNELKRQSHDRAGYNKKVRFE